jgi:hypothetical protein
MNSTPTEPKFNTIHMKSGFSVGLLGVGELACCDTGTSATAPEAWRSAFVASDRMRRLKQRFFEASI